MLTLAILGILAVALLTSRSAIDLFVLPVWAAFLIALVWIGVLCNWAVRWAVRLARRNGKSS